MISKADSNKLEEVQTLAGDMILLKPIGLTRIGTTSVAF